MRNLSRRDLPIRGIFFLLACLAFASEPRAELSVVIAYDTQAVGEIEPCG